MQTVKKTVQAFLEKIDKKERKVTGKIEALQQQAEKLQVGIDASVAEIVHLEMDDNQTAADKIRNKVRNDRSKLSEIQEEITAYEGVMSKPAFDYSDAARNIQLQAQQAESKRRLDEQDKQAHIEKLEGQIEDLKAEVQRVSIELRSSSDYPLINLLKPVVSALDKRFSQLGYSEQESYIRQWVRGGDVEGFFRSAPEHRGITQTYGEGHRYGYGPDDVVGAHNRKSVTLVD